MKPMGGHYYSREKLRSRLLNRSLTQASFLHLTNGESHCLAEQRRHCIADLLEHLGLAHS